MTSEQLKEIEIKFHHYIGFSPSHQEPEWSDYDEAGGADDILDLINEVKRRISLDKTGV